MLAHESRGSSLETLQTHPAATKQLAKAFFPGAGACDLAPYDIGPLANPIISEELALSLRARDERQSKLH